MYIHTYVLNYQDSLQLYPSLKYGDRTYDSLHVYKDEAALPPILHTHQEQSELFHFLHEHYILYTWGGACKSAVWVRPIWLFCNIYAACTSSICFCLETLPPPRADYDKKDSAAFFHWTGRLENVSSRVGSGYVKLRLLENISGSLIIRVLIYTLNRLETFSSLLEEFCMFDVPHLHITSENENYWYNILVGLGC